MPGTITEGLIRKIQRHTKKGQWEPDCIKTYHGASIKFRLRLWIRQTIILFSITDEDKVLTP